MEVRIEFDDFEEDNIQIFLKLPRKMISFLVGLMDGED